MKNYWTNRQTRQGMTDWLCSKQFDIMALCGFANHASPFVERIRNICNVKTDDELREFYHRTKAEYGEVTTREDLRK